MKRELLPLTSLRAIAAFLVFVFHIYAYANTEDNSSRYLFDQIAATGFIGVSVFFVLSGFVLSLRYYDEIEQGTFSWPRYLLHRFARLYPLYVVVLLAHSVLTNTPPTLLNLSLLHTFFSDYWQTGIMVAWTLTAELVFYLLFPLVIWTVQRVGTARARLVSMLGAWAFGMLLLGLALSWLSQTTGVNQQAGFLNDYNFTLNHTAFGYMFDFVVGVFFYIVYRQVGAPNTRLANTLSVVTITAIVLSQLYLYSTGNSWDKGRLMVYVVAALCGLLIWTLTCRDCLLARWLSQPSWVYAGRVSYALFLIHLTALVAWMRPAGWFVVYVAANVLAALLYEFVERPAHGWITSAYQRFFPHRPEHPPQPHEPLTYQQVRDG